MRDATLKKLMFLCAVFLTSGFGNLSASTQPVLINRTCSVELSKTSCTNYGLTLDYLRKSSLKEQFNLTSKLESTIIIKKRVGMKKTILYPFYKTYTC